MVPGCDGIRFPGQLIVFQNRLLNDPSGCDTQLARMEPGQNASHHFCYVPQHQTQEGENLCKGTFWGIEIEASHGTI